MKKILKAVAACLAAVSLAACGSKGLLSVQDTDNTIIVTAENAAKGSEASATIEVAENELVMVSAMFTGGKIHLTMNDVKDGIEDEPSVDFVFEEDGQTNYQLEAGLYSVMVDVTDKANATIMITTAPMPAEAKTDEPAAEDGQNPVMNFIGTYANSRCSILVEPEGQENAKITITWGSSAAEIAEWTMSGKFDADTLTVAYTDGVKKDIFFKEDGTVDTEEILYENGTGTFTFMENNGLSLIWKDDVEHMADDLVFDYAN